MSKNVWGEGKHVKANYFGGKHNLAKFDGCKITSLDLTIIMQDVTDRSEIKELISQLERLELSLEYKRVGGVNNAT